jgi:hypothetical protein
VPIVDLRHAIGRRSWRDGPGAQLISAGDDALNVHGARWREYHLDGRHAEGDGVRLAPKRWSPRRGKPTC